MQKIDGQPVYSASDLVGYLACEHLTALERAALHGLTSRPEADDPELDVLRARGAEHEKRYLAELEAAGLEVAVIESSGPAEDRGERLRLATAATEAAMARGRTQADRSSLEPFPLDAWPDIPTRALIAADDRFFDPGWVERVTRDRLGIEPDFIASGHCVALAHPLELVERLEGYRAAIVE